MKPCASNFSRLLQKFHYVFIVALFICAALTEPTLAHHLELGSFGHSVKGAGDVNNDGYNDLIVVGRHVEEVGPDLHKKAVQPEKVYIYYGSSKGIDNSPDVVLTGEMVSDRFGDSISVGDVNNDSIPDIIIGAYKNDAGGLDAGRVYIYYGRSEGINETSDVILTGQMAGEGFGLSLAGGGDVNNDGISDLIIGARPINRRGKVYVFMGRENGLSIIPGLVLIGEENDDQFGWSLSLGDINGDGTVDIIVGAPLHDGIRRDAGRVYTYLGGSRVDDSPDIILNGKFMNELFGYSVHGAEDLNGDGLSDIVIGAPLSNRDGSKAGSVYIYYGDKQKIADKADMVLEGRVAYGRFGSSIGAGDVNSDGIADVAIGMGASLQSIFVYIYYGGLGQMDDSVDVILASRVSYDQFGSSVATEDANNDSIIDVIIGAPGGEGGADTGKVYIYYGSSDGIDAVEDLILSGEAALVKPESPVKDLKETEHQESILTGERGSIKANIVQLRGKLNPYPTQKYSDIWGYAMDGREYALMGVKTGLSIIDVTDPATPVEVAFIPGPSSTWRDIKTHLTYAYVTTEGIGAGAGMQIIDLSNLPIWATLINTYTDTFTRAHNLYISDGFAYVVGTSPSGFMHILDLADPVNPVEVSVYTEGGEIHDVYVKNDIGYLASGWSQDFDIVDLSNKANPVLLARVAYPFGIYAHQCWTTEDDRFMLCDDEFNVVDLLVFDISDLQNIKTFTPFNSPTSPIHNVFVKGNLAHISYYTDGYVVLDITAPTQPVQVGSYDTFPGPNNVYDGAWGAYPFTPSGAIYVSDMSTGLYVFALSPGISGTVNGLASKAICKNKVTVQKVKNPFTPPNWDCGGLSTIPGDKVVVTLKGKSNGSAISGTVTGLNPVTRVKCKNRTTLAKATGTVALPNWDCGPLPLPTSGDRVRVRIKGQAQ